MKDAVKAVVSEGASVVEGAESEPVGKGKGAVDASGKGGGERASESVSLDTIERLGKVFGRTAHAPTERGSREQPRKRREAPVKPPVEPEDDGDGGEEEETDA